MARNLPPRRPFVTRPVRRAALGVQQNRVVTIMGEADYTGSTLTSSVFAVTANGSATTTLEATVYRTVDEGAPTLASGETVTYAVERAFVSASLSSVTTNSVSVANDGVEYAIISVTLLNASSTPLPDIPAASLTPSSTGSNNTFTAIDTVTDANGVFRWQFASTTAEAKTITVTALGLAVTDTAAVTFTGAPVAPWFEEAWDYTDTANMEADPNGWFDADTLDEYNPTYNSITLLTGLTTPWGGTKAMRISMFDASAEPVDEMSVGKNLTFPGAGLGTSREIWLEYYIRFSADFDPSVGGTTYDYKCMFLQHQINGDSSRLRYRWSVGNLSAYRVMMFPSSEPATSNADATWTFGATGLTADWVLAYPDMFDGTWHQVRTHAVISTDDATADGSYTQWLDGTLVFDKTGYINATASTIYTPDTQYYASMALGRNITLPNRDQEVDWGRIRVFTTDPGWV